MALGNNSLVTGEIFPIRVAQIIAEYQEVKMARKVRELPLVYMHVVSFAHIRRRERERQS
jgi:hypothetical protein